jgi:hypothetical protein
MRHRNKIFVLILIASNTVLLSNSLCLADEYIQVPGLIDLRTDFSDGAHTLDFLIKLAKKRGFNVLFITDHDREVLEYGIWPFQNILKKKVEEASINKGGPENYLNMIRSASQRHPEMILIPGAESSPFYYWKGSYFTKNLTVCDWERHLLILGLEKPEDYKELPILHNGYSTKFLSSIRIGFFIPLIPLIISLYMIKRKKIIKYLGIVILVLSLLLFFNNHPFRSSPFDQYHGSQGISPYQLLIDYVNSRGGYAFWNHPETKSGYGRLGPINRETRPYPQVLTESKNYAGFAALYGDSITVTEPGNIWDKVLIEYCSGQREKPVWGISTADFHKEGGAGEELGNFPTIFLVREKTKKDILEAMKKGRMYACRGDVVSPRLVLGEFSISDPETSQKGVMGDEIFFKGNPRINILISTTVSEEENPIIVRLIRNGKLLKTFSGETPLNINFQDEFMKPGKKIYYRLDVKDRKGGKLISNPIFVEFQD